MRLWTLSLLLLPVVTGNKTPRKTSRLQFSVKPTSIELMCTKMRSCCNDPVFQAYKPVDIPQSSSCTSMASVSKHKWQKRFASDAILMCENGGVGYVAGAQFCDFQINISHKRGRIVIDSKRWDAEDNTANTTLFYPAAETFLLDRYLRDADELLLDIADRDSLSDNDIIGQAVIDLPPNIGDPAPKYSTIRMDMFLFARRYRYPDSIVYRNQTELVHRFDSCGDVYAKVSLEFGVS